MVHILEKYVPKYIQMLFLTKKQTKQNTFVDKLNLTQKGNWTEFGNFPLVWTIVLLYYKLLVMLTILLIKKPGN